jgi:hypothetical protein
MRLLRGVNVRTSPHAQQRPLLARWRLEPPVTAVYDANIVYPAPLRDLFIRVAQTGLVLARWTETIHAE